MPLSINAGDTINILYSGEDLADKRNVKLDFLPVEFESLPDWTFYHDIYKQYTGPLSPTHLPTSYKKTS